MELLQWLDVLLFIKKHQFWFILGIGLLVLLLLPLIAHLVRRMRSAMISDTPITVSGDGLIRWVYHPGNAQHIGKRDEQQDAFGFSDVTDFAAVRSQGVLAVLADGMGGVAGGKEAAKAAVEAVMQHFQQQVEHAQSAQTLLEEAAQRAHRAIEAVQRTMPSDAGLAGSTLCVVWIREGRLSWISLGDSRIYLVSGEQLTLLTVDDNYGMELDEKARRGLITVEQAQASTERHMLTAYLGSPDFDELALDVYSIDIEPGDKVMLCSDGIYGSVTEAEMQQAVKHPVQQACDALQELALAKENQYQDNMTAIMIAVEVRK